MSLTPWSTGTPPEGVAEHAIRILGGPFDGLFVYKPSGDEGLLANRMVDISHGNGTEPYWLSWDDETGWKLTHASIRKPPSDDPDLSHARMAHSDAGAEMDRPCDPGEHRWTEWARTQRAWVRHCSRCGVSQPRVV